MDVLVLIARILFSALFLVSAYGHLTRTKAMAGYAASKNVPLPGPAVIISGVLILLGGLMVLLGLWGDLGALFLVVFLVPAAFLVHNFWVETDPMSRQMETVQFNKDIALAGAAIAFLVLFSYAGPDLGLTLTDPVFSIGH
jgi:putative oxidoreductase